MVIEKTTNEVQDLLNKAKAKIVDVREVEAYNGWGLKGENRGGHIAGAKSLPSK